jgi:hypothetical protein
MGRQHVWERKRPPQRKFSALEVEGSLPLSVVSVSSVGKIISSPSARGSRKTKNRFSNLNLRVHIDGNGTAA